jgi:hypothetical protein
VRSSEMFAIVHTGAELFEKPGNVGPDRTDRRGPAQRERARAADYLIERKRIGVRSQLRAGFFERHVANFGPHRHV